MYKSISNVSRVFSPCVTRYNFGTPAFRRPLWQPSARLPLRLGRPSCASAAGRPLSRPSAPSVMPRTCAAHRGRDGARGLHRPGRRRAAALEDRSRLPPCRGLRHEEAVDRQRAEKQKAKALKAELGAYSLAALTPDLMPSTATSACRPVSPPALYGWNSPSCHTCSRSPSRKGVSACLTIQFPISASLPRFRAGPAA